LKEEEKEPSTLRPRRGGPRCECGMVFPSPKVRSVTTGIKPTNIWGIRTVRVEVKGMDFFLRDSFGRWGRTEIMAAPFRAWGKDFLVFIMALRKWW